MNPENTSISTGTDIAKAAANSFITGMTVNIAGKKRKKTVGDLMRTMKTTDR